MGDILHSLCKQLPLMWLRPLVSAACFLLSRSLRWLPSSAQKGYDGCVDIIQIFEILTHWSSLTNADEQMYCIYSAEKRECWLRECQRLQPLNQVPHVQEERHLVLCLQVAGIQLIKCQRILSRLKGLAGCCVSVWYVGVVCPFGNLSFGCELLINGTLSRYITFFCSEESFF